MNNSEYNKAENAVNKTENSLQNAADKAKWKVEDLADKARDYINEKRNNDEEAQQEDWFDRVKANVSKHGKTSKIKPTTPGRKRKMQQKM
ncbi:hypothetical protein [Chryseobacterium wanjuense]